MGPELQLFQWDKKLFKVSALPFGLNSVPRIFTKFLKTVFAKLREEGHSGFAFIDDSFLVGETAEECRRAMEKLEGMLVPATCMVPPPPNRCLPLVPSQRKTSKSVFSSVGFSTCTESVDYMKLLTAFSLLRSLKSQFWIILCANHWVCRGSDWVFISVLQCYL